MFSHDVMAAIFVSQNNETAATFVSQTSPVGVEFFRELASLMLVTVSINLVKVTAYHCTRTYCSPKLSLHRLIGVHSVFVSLHVELPCEQRPFDLTRKAGKI